MAVFQHAAAYELFTGVPADPTRMAIHFTELTGLDVLGESTKTGRPRVAGYPI